MNKIRITPIGTCRIHTPLRRASARYPIEVEHARNYGFVHTSEEALQLVRFLQGDKQFDDRVAPLVARDGGLEEYQSQEWHPSDLHIVEISSAKRIMSGHDAIQANYLSHHFPDFFASPARVRKFWSLVKNAHRADLLAFLESEETYRLLSTGDRDLLASLQMEPQSFKAIKTDMEEIVERLGRDKLLFVTHINATTPDGELIGLRDRLIRWVKMAADQLNARVFDPSDLMNELGQESALESAGLDLTHYTPTFSDAVYAQIHDLYVRELVGAVHDDGQICDEDEAKLARQSAKFEAMLETGDYFSASRQVHQAINAAPAALPLIELRGRIRSQIGDFAGAVDDLTLRDDTRALSQANKFALVEALNATGHYAEALDIVEDLFGEEFESAELYRAAAFASRRLGNQERLITYLKQAFRLDRTDLASALAALVQLRELGAVPEAAAWRHEMLANITDSASGALEACLWAIDNYDDELFSAALTAVARVDKPGSIDLLEDAFEAGLYPAVASSVEIVLGLGRLSRTLSERRLAIINRLLELAAAQASDGQLESAFEIANALIRCEYDVSSQIPGRKIAASARRLIHQMSKQIKLEIRDAYKERDATKAFRLAEAAGDLLLELPDAAAAYSRALHDVGKTADALAVMERTLQKNQHSFTALRWTARFASIVGDYALALESYGKLRRSEDPERQKIEPEIERFFSNARPRALKQLRILVAEGEYDEAVHLAELISKEAGGQEEVSRLLDRLHSTLRRKLKIIEKAEGDPEELESLVRQISDLRPTDGGILRKLAAHLMRQLRFAEAAEIWGRISALEPEDEIAMTKRERCVKMAERRSAAWRAQSNA